jgi:hypothetical protein
MRDRLKFGSVVCALGAFALVVAGCSSSSHSTASTKPKATAATTTPTTALATPVTASNGIQIIKGSATGTSACEKAQPTPASPGQVGGGGGGNAAVQSQAAVLEEEHGGRGAVVQHSLTHAQRDELETQMAEARTVVAKFPTVASAEAAGYKRSTPYVPCIGAHYTNTGLAGAFNPAAPSELLYDGTTPDSKLVGLSYLVYNPGGQPPAGFAGPNDHWHQHNANGGLCFKGATVVGGEEMTRAQCAAIGGRKGLLNDIWMLHAWVVPGFECSWGVFSGECPELGGLTCGNAWDAPDPNNLSLCKQFLSGSN